MSESLKGLRVRNFFDIEAKTLLDRFRVVETLLPNSKTKGAAHRGEEGRYIETLLRSFLNKHLPEGLRAVSGFILCPSTKTGVGDLRRVQGKDDRHSSQLDIIIYDFNFYPVFERFEEFCIVPPEGVVAIISVKKKLYNADIHAEVVALKAASDLCQTHGRRGPMTALFAFSAEDKNDESLNGRIFKAIKATHSGASFDPMLNEASVIARTCIFKFRPEHSRNGSVRYVSIPCAAEPHIPLQRLLQSIFSVYYDETRIGPKDRPGFVSFRKDTFRDAPELGLVACSDLDRWQAVTPP